MSNKKLMRMLEEQIKQNAVTQQQNAITQQQNTVLQQQIITMINNSKANVVNIINNDSTNTIKNTNQIKEVKKVKKEEEKEDDSVIFGSTDIPLDLYHLKELVDSKKIKLLKKTLVKYFAVILPEKGSSCYIYWDAYKKNIIYHDKQSLSTFLPESFNVVGQDESGKKITLFSCYKFIRTEIFDRFRIVLNFDNNKKFYRENNQCFVNKWEGFLHTERKPYKEYPKKIKAGVQKIWNHVYEVWCSSNDNVFGFYTKPYMAHMCIGQKQTAALYLKGGQGIGKTVVCDFIRHNVMGDNVTTTLDEIEPLMDGAYNDFLCGKRFVVCEELPTDTKSKWCTLENRLKVWITNKDRSYRGKYITNFIGRNLSSFILLTNNPYMKISSDDRRLILLDLSTKYLGNTEYFNEIAEIIEGKDRLIYGEAFFWYCVEYCEKYKEEYGKPFNAQDDKPTTNAKKKNTIEHLPTLYEYIKREFVLKNKGIEKQKVQKFTNEYSEALQQDLQRQKLNKRSVYKTHPTNLSSRIISDELRTLSIEPFKSTGNYMFIEISKEKLKKLFENKHWIDEYDEFKDNDKEDIDISLLDSELIKEGLVKDTEDLQFLEDDEEFPENNEELEWEELEKLNSQCREKYKKSLERNIDIPPQLLNYDYTYEALKLLF
jgi:hypothetical protein